jgi:hypothetical protein
MAYVQLREHVLDDIVTDLAAIDGSVDYYLTVSKITRNLADLPIVSASDLPCCIVVPMEAVPEPGLSDTYGAQLYVGILAAVYEETDQEDSGALETEREKLLSDVVMAVLADPRRGGYATDTRLIRAVVEEEEAIPMAMVWLVFGVWMDYATDTP